METTISEPIEQLHLTDREIFTKIWTAPRLVMKFINDNKYDKYERTLLILAGISRTFDRACNGNTGETMPLLGIIVMCIVLGGLLGWVSFYFYAALVSWMGRWLNAKGNTTSLLRMIAYGMFPSILALLALVPQIAVYGSDLFKKNAELTDGGPTANLVFWSAFVIECILAIWTIVIIVVGTSEVQKLSIGKAILNLLLPVAVIVVPLLGIVGIVNLFK